MPGFPFLGFVGKRLYVDRSKVSQNRAIVSGHYGYLPWTVVTSASEPTPDAGLQRRGNRESHLGRYHDRCSVRL